jgi:multicomponent K+:H+ antiporter subunit F
MTSTVPLLATLLPYALGVFAFALILNALRLFKGPSLADRILALDTLYVNMLALVILVGVAFNATVYFEVALLIALLGFIGTVVLAKFVLRGDIVE